MWILTLLEAVVTDFQNCSMIVGVKLVGQIHPGSF